MHRECYMKIWFISDTHNKHEQLAVPDVDLVIHCGDESESGEPWTNEPESRRFFRWFSALDIPTKIFVPGNHSTAVEHGLIRAEDYPNVTFLIHAQTDWRGFKIFGTPYTPKFFEWAYMRERSELDIVWQSIPNNIDILITHGPPKGFFDLTRDMDTREPVHVGSKSLRRHVLERIKPKIHAFGHIHDEKSFTNYGIVTRNETQFINCSCCDLSGRLKNKGFVIEVGQQSTTELPQHF